MRFQIIPAIDIMDGNAVRLTQGDFGSVAKVADDPVLAAARFRECGATWLHVVDLDGAKDGKAVNTKLIERIIDAADMYVEVGGGIRDMRTIRKYLDLGVARVILGSAAVNNPRLLYDALSRYGPAIAVGIDSAGGIVKTAGWLESSGRTAMDVASEVSALGVHTIIATDIGRDGTLGGPNFELLTQLNDSVQSNIIASGGVRDLDDVINLAKSGLYGAIVGKAAYDGSLDLKEAYKQCR